MCVHRLGISMMNNIQPNSKGDQTPSRQKGTEFQGMEDMTGTDQRKDGQPKWFSSRWEAKYQTQSCILLVLEGAKLGSN